MVSSCFLFSIFSVYYGRGRYHFPSRCNDAVLDCVRYRIVRVGLLYNPKDGGVWFGVIESVVDGSHKTPTDNVLLEMRDEMEFVQDPVLYGCRFPFL
ncbi:hypothetical protein OE88DRAFT_51725 [Heliocybe sulcata]|uniref:Uncharacterized protein n=1 Tax=Heliocybe sulcata TaxID=5364 RepID=A0A5C3NFQ8_9AGAM|nr:hypothetical protein OE88DRAFT_51725 [Heliocybe sulcata]